MNLNFAPSEIRRFLTKHAAASREASAMIGEKYPAERQERDEFGRVVDAGWHWREDDRLGRVHARLTARILRRSFP